MTAPGRTEGGRIVVELAERVRNVRDRIERAAGRADRDPASVTLVAVSKKRCLDEVMQAHAAGIVDFGENRIQEAVDKHGGAPHIGFH